MENSSKKAKAPTSGEDEEIFVLHVSKCLLKSQSVFLSFIIFIFSIFADSKVKGRERYEFLKRINEGQDALELQR